MKIDRPHITDLMERSAYIIERVGKKTAVMVLTLPNGYEITVSSACNNPEDFDLSIGREICMKKAEDKLWELEGYAARVREQHKESERLAVEEGVVADSLANTGRLRVVKRSVGWIEAYAAIYNSPTARIRIPGWVPGVQVMAGQGCERGMLIMVDSSGRESRWIPCGPEAECRVWEIWDET